MSSKKTEYVDRIEQIVEKYPEYHPDAYRFILSGLNFTIKEIGKPGHVTGQDLSRGIMSHANEEFGPMARTVFDHWGLQETLDFGKIVYNMIEAQLMSRQETDTIEDFKDVVDFDEYFSEPYDYLSGLKKKKEKAV